MIAVVVLTYRADPELLDGCIRSVLVAGGADHVVVVDNGGSLTRDRLDAVVQRASAPGVHVHLLHTHENLGYAGGMNAGISHALSLGPHAIALLNDDTVVEPGWIEAMDAHLRRPRIGGVQPKLLLGRPGIDQASPPLINSAGMSVRNDGAGVDIGYGEPDRGQYGTCREIDLWTGGAVLLARAFLEDVGGFDERYFLYYEDIDLARRGAASGWTFVFEPEAVVHHSISSTAGSDPALYRYWQERNRLWWVVRHGTASQIVRALWLSLLRLGRHPSAPQARAIRDGVRGAPRCWRERRQGRNRVRPLPVTAPVPWSVT